MARPARLAAIVFLAGARAFAQGADPGIAADRFVPAAGPDALLTIEGAAVPPRDRVDVVVAAGFVARPITIVDRNTGALVSRPVSALATVDAGLEIGLWRRLAIGLGMPMTLYARGDRLANLGVGDDRPLASPKLGDVRFRAKVALAETGSVRLAVAGIFTLPAGGESDFAATSGPTFEPRLIGDVTTRFVTVAAQLGVRFMPDRLLFGTHFGDELTFAIGASAGWRRFRIVTELAGAVGEVIHPVEARGALRFLLPHALSVDAGAGAGLDQDPTAPQWRLFFVLRSD